MSEELNDSPSVNQPEEGSLSIPRVVSRPCQTCDWYDDHVDSEGYINQRCHNCWMGRRVRTSE